MKFFRYIYLIFITAIVIQSCDKIDAPFKEKGIGGDTAQVVRKILLEEFTGHICPNCPTASKLAHDLKLYAGNQLILLSIHGGFLAKPSTSPYTYDFTCNLGDELFIHFGNPNPPKGLINRIERNGSQIIETGDWNTFVDSLLQVEQDAQIEITNNYIENTRVLNTTVETEFFNPITGPIALCVYIVEDSIIAPQKNNDPIISPDEHILDYVHMHVLRGSMNGTWGDTLIQGNPVVNQKYSKSYSFTLDNAWEAKNCGVVAFVYYIQNEEIIQAEEKHIE
ncbi:Omp28 family outer membrane lipoprotein [candidate division KSB1 bacterium]